MKKALFTACAALFVLGIGNPAHAQAQRCRDAQGHFAKCPAPAPKPAPAPTRAPAAQATAANNNAARCRDAQGHFAKCGTVAAPAPQPRATAAPQPRMTTAARPSTATGQNTHPGGPNGATAKCRDNTYSSSAHRSGTCSRHGGVAQWY
jgi:hypothetical protein